MFNKIINREKIVKEVNSNKIITIVNSRQEEIGILLYDNAYSIGKDDYEELRFSFNDSKLGYFFKINFKNILMYDTKKNQLIIKAI